MSREAHVQYVVYHPTRKILRSRMVINQPRWIREAHEEMTDNDGDARWIGGTLEKILKTPGVAREDVARAMGVRKD